MAELRRFLAFTLYLLLVLTSIQSAPAQSSCPKPEDIAPCRCSQRGEELQLWCSHSELPHVMAGLRAASLAITRTIDELILENNNLPSLPGRALFTLRVMRLMLRNNGLQRVSSGWLVGLEDSLMELYIVEDELRSLPMDSLDKLRKLEAVTIQSRSIKRIPSFTGLPKLRYLYIESASLMELNQRYFRMLPTLETLHVIGSPRLNRLEAGFLEDLPNLSKVNVSNNGISWVHLRAFSRLPLLQYLSLSSNKLSDAGMVGRALRDLPALIHIQLDDNHITKLGEASFVDLPSLREVCLSRNRIVEIGQGAFHRVPMLRTLDLNHNYIRKIHPESFMQPSGSGVEELWLVGNDIDNASELRAVLNALPRLRFLDMSQNRLQEIPFGILRGHATLERLHLDNNRLQLIEREALTAMPALRELRLQNNSLSNLLPTPFWNLPALKGLDLSLNFFRRIEPRLLVNLPSLRKLNLQGNAITIIDPVSFLETPLLESINISNNALTSLHPATFRHLAGLFELDASYNRLVEFVPGLPRGVETLHLSRNQITAIPLPPSPDMDLPALRTLDLSGNGIQSLPSGAMRALAQLHRLQISRNGLKQIEDGSFDGLTRLETLDLSENRIVHFSENSLRYMRQLKTLNIRNNKLEIIREGLLLDAGRLVHLDMSNNKLIEIRPGVLQNVRELVNLDLSGNILTQLPETLMGLRALEKLDASSNRLTALPHDMRSLTSLGDLNLSGNRITTLKQGAIQYMPLLKELDLSDNTLEIIEPGAIRALPYLSSVLLARNKLSELREAVFSDLPALQNAELQQNRLHTISNRAFYRVSRMLMLNLSHNLIDDLDRAGLRGLRSLEVLDLSYNRVGRVQNSGLRNLEWLVELNLDNNVICAVHGAPFSGMPRLRVLSLRNNKMTNLAEPAVQALRSNIAVLDIDGNPLSCSCGLLWMRAWMQEAQWAGPRCADGTMLRDTRLSRHQCLTNSARIAEPIEPGCESELLDDHIPLPGTSPWLEKIKQPSNTNAIDRPSPEESEYFYDEYVDYPFNETITHGNNGTHRPINITQESTTPRTVTGNTPAFYAGSNFKSNFSSTIKPTKQAVTPSATFTFFGVPLPSLNIGKLWGSGRNSADRKNDPTSLLGSSRGTGRIQNYPVDAPDVQTGGFVPILPGTSGNFKPLNDPFEEIPQNTTTSWPDDFPSSKFNTRQDQNSSETESTTEFNVLQQIPTSYSTYERVTIPMTPLTNFETSTDYGPSTTGNDELAPAAAYYSTVSFVESTTAANNENYSPSGVAGFLANIRENENTSYNHTDPAEVTSEEATNKSPYTIEQNYDDVRNVYDKSDYSDYSTTGAQNNSMPEITTNESSEYFESTTGSTYSPIPTYRSPSTIEDKIISTTVPSEVATPEILDEVLLQNNMNVEEFWPQTNKNPSLLSDILAPNGHPPFFRIPAGRPTITKVVLAEQTLPTAEEFLHTPSPIEIETIASYELTTAKTIYNDTSMNWYFDNYNKSSHVEIATHMEPGLNRYRSRGTYKYSSQSLLFSLTFAVYLIC